MKFFALLLLTALLCAAVGAFLFYAPAGPPAGTPDDKALYIDIAPGSGTAAIAAQLESAGVLRSRYAFYLLREIKGGKLIAGEYRFNHPATAAEVYSRIVRGDIFFIPLTIPEGYNIFDIAQAVELAHLGSRADFLAAEQKQTSLISDLSPHAPSLEGYLFPDTYRFGRHSTPLEMLSAMVRRFRQAAAGLGLDGPQEAIAGLSLGPSQNLILASLVEKEVAQPSERPLVAGVFLNRLTRGIPLATDPSVIYAALLESRYRGTIYASDLQSPSPYNTYRHPGLPPGPICNPGIAALKAALHPSSTDYLYFVADAQGHSRFSATLEEHATQVQDYRKATDRATAPPKTAPAPTSHRRRK